MSDQAPNEIDLFAAAAELPTDQRAEFLSQACGDDRELRDRVAGYLAAHERPGPLDAAAPLVETALQALPSPDAFGAQIGPYKLRERIGEGGMGEVYVAEQTEPVRRKVALKIIRPGMATKDVLARFESERQALAMMDHPNIARIFDGGTVGDKGVRNLLPERPAGCFAQKVPDTFVAQPYFVMELVQGPPITEYCDEHRLGTRERLELFGQVCRAVRHAHQKGIIHRDLKPSNILVPRIDGAAVPKVIDFGVAKALGQALTERTLYTQFSQMVGTPLYMSPEQAEPGVVDVDTRSDVYSLGVLLYELLTGHTPFDRESLQQAGFDEMRRIIREDEPPRPSARISTLAAADLSTVAQRRKSDPRKLSGELQGELDWLVMKALEKDRNRRYESATALAEDVERYLNDEPVVARPPSATYRLSKFVRRNRTAVAVAGVVLLSLVAGVISTTIQWRRVASQRNRAVAAETSERAARKDAEQLALDKAAMAASERRQRQQADVIRLAAQSRAVRNEFPTQSVLLAIEAVERSREHFGDALPAAHEALFNATVAVAGKPLAGHADGITSIEISPNDRWVVTGSYDGTARVWDLAARDPGSSPLVLKGHVGPVRSVAVSPDSRWVATAGSDAGVRLWNLAALHPAESSIELTGHTDAVWSVTFNSTGRLLVTGSADNTVRVWNLAKEAPDDSPLVLDCVEAEMTPIAKMSVLISPNSRWVAVARIRDNNSHTPRVWDLTLKDPNESPHDLVDHNDWIQSMTFSGDSRWLITGSRASSARLWDLTADDPGDAPIVLDEQIVSGPGAEDVAISPDGRWLATAEHELQLWDLSSDAPNDSPRVLEGREKSVSRVAFSADGRWLTAGGGDRTVRAWQLTEDGAVARKVELEGHESEVQHVKISSDGRWIVSAAMGESHARLWDLSRMDPNSSSLVLPAGEPGPLESVYPFRIAIAVSQDGRWLVTRTGDGSIRLWDLALDEPERNYRELQGYDHLASVSISANGRWAIAGGVDGRTMLWDLSRENGHSMPIVLPEQPGKVYAEVTPNGRWAVTASDMSALRLWNLTASDPADAMLELLAWREYGDEVKICISPDSRWLVASKYSDSNPRIWDLTVENPASTKRILEGDVAGISFHCMAFDDKSRRLIASSQGTHVWDLLSDDPTSPVMVVEGKRGDWQVRHINRAALSPNGRWLVTSEYSHTTQRHDLAHPDPTSTRRVLRGFPAEAWWLSISPDGRWLAAGSTDGTARLWELEAPNIEATMRTLRGHRGSVQLVFFSGDSRWLITGGADAKAILWPLDMDELLDRARRVAGRELSEEERAQFGLDNGNE